MPKQVIQYPRTDDSSGTEISIHWNKDQGYVQLGVTRHVWIPGGPHDPGKLNEYDPASGGPLPLGVQHIDHNYCSHCNLPPLQAAIPTVQSNSAVEPLDARSAYFSQTTAVEREDAQRLAEEGLTPTFAPGVDPPQNPVADPPTTIYSDALNRGEINEMIRVLRRARDQAYGADA